MLRAPCARCSSCTSPRSRWRCSWPRWTRRASSAPCSCPVDCTTAHGCRIVTNEQVAELAGKNPRFIGFASVDPAVKDAPRQLERAVRGLGLKGPEAGPRAAALPPRRPAAGVAAVPGLRRAGRARGDPLRPELVPGRAGEVRPAPRAGRGGAGVPAPSHRHRALRLALGRGGAPGGAEVPECLPGHLDRVRAARPADALRRTCWPSGSALDVLERSLAAPDPVRLRTTRGPTSAARSAGMAALPLSPSLRERSRCAPNAEELL